jgi:molecular chaperone GrpE
MPTYFDPYRRRGVQPRPGALPTGDDIQRLAQALHAKAEQQAQLLEAQQRELESKRRELAMQNETLADVKRELEIKNDALRRQGEALKQVEAELVWARAGLQQQERKEEQKNSPEEASWRERYVRLQAELENLRRRWEQRFENETANARQEILRDMLPLADHLELALRHGEAVQDEQAQEHVRNIHATLQAFLNTLKRYNVTPIDAVGQPFDPNVHEALGQVADGDVESGSVAQVVQTGYMEGDKLLRPARVLVRE